MKITDVRVVRVVVPAVKSYDTSLSKQVGYAKNRRDHLLVFVETDEGHVGVGESAPTAYWPRGLTPTAIKSLIEEVYRPLLVGRDPRHLGEIIPHLERALADAPFALAAVDIALWDVWGKAEGRPVYELLGGLVRDRIPLHYSVGIKSPEEVREEALRAKELGYVHFKVKVGGPDFDAEVAAVRAIREAVGEEAQIRVDANQGWSADEAIRKLRVLNEYRLVLVEQPVPYWDVYGLARVRQATGIPVLADEACFRPSDVIQLVRIDAADIINIKLMKCGGLWNARKIAYVAEAAGLSCFMGGMLEMEVGAAAGIHFTAAHEVVRYPTGILNTFTERPLGTPPWVVERGYALLKERRPGLGIELDEEAIAYYRVD